MGIFLRIIKIILMVISFPLVLIIVAMGRISHSENYRKKIRRRYLLEQSKKRELTYDEYQELYENPRDAFP